MGVHILNISDEGRERLMVRNNRNGYCPKLKQVLILYFLLRIFLTF